MKRDEELKKLSPRVFLQKEFSKRRAKNPAYSMRAFAKMLGLPPGRLSEILARKRKLTGSVAEKIASSLTFTPSQRRAFLAAVTEESVLPKAEILAPVERGAYEDLTEDEFEVIAGREHFALLNLMKTRDFKNDIRWMSHRLQLSAVEVRAALERLERLGLIREVRGKLVRTKDQLATSNDIRSSALRRYHRENLQRNIDALENVSLEVRDVTAITMAIDPRRIPQAKKLIQEFRRNLSALLEGGRKEEVYTLSIQLIPNTQIKKQ